jgi:hypothetical protein
MPFAVTVIWSGSGFALSAMYQFTSADGELADAGTVPEIEYARLPSTVTSFLPNVGLLIFGSELKSDFKVVEVVMAVQP